MDVTLDELVEHSDRLLTEIQKDTDLPMITRSLEQMGAFGERLCSTRGARSDVKAARLLGSKINYELPKALSDKLESFNATSELNFTKVHADTDIHSFLKNERENILFTANEQAKKSAFLEVSTISKRATSVWWDQQAAAILTALASTPGPIDTAVTHPLTPFGDYETNRSTMINNMDCINSDNYQQCLSKEEIFYAKQVNDYVTDLLKSTQNFVSGHITSAAGFHSKPALVDFLYPDTKVHGLDETLNSSVFLDESKHSDSIETLRLVRRMFAPVSHLSDLNVETLLTDLPLEDNSASVSALNLRTKEELQLAFLNRAIIHLEVEFTSYIVAMVASNPHQAQLGGRPSTRSLVRAFLNVKGLPTLNCSSMEQDFTQFSGFEDGLVDDKPVWPMIYYCLRCGAFQDAISIANDAVNNLGDFALILESYLKMHRHLPSNTVTNLRKTYRRVVKISRDPFKRIVYCLLGRFDLSDTHNEVAQSIDDFMWLRLSQISISNSNSPADSISEDDEESLTLAKLQTLLYDTHGETHFDAWNQPFTFFKLLFLSQQFEGGVAFLARFEHFRCHAVHIGLLLSSLDLLITTPSLQAQLVIRLESDPIGFRRINLSRLILLYTRKFETKNPCYALNYYYFLRDIEVNSDDGNIFGPSTVTATVTHVSKISAATNRGDESKNMGNLFIQCVSELVVQLRQFDQLLGSKTDGEIRQPGAIDRFCNDTSRSKISASKIIAAVAETLESRGQLLDAVQVYLLAGSSYNLSAVRIINLLLVSAISSNNENVVGEMTSNENQTDRQFILDLAAKVGRTIQRLNLPNITNDSSIESSSSLRTASQTLFLLLDLSAFFELATTSQWQTALDHMDQIGLFPTNVDQIESKVVSFSKLSNIVRRLLPNAVIATMHCLIAKASQSKSTVAFGDYNRSVLGSKLENAKFPTTSEARSRARALITFIGRIQFRMPGEVYARLSQLEMQLS